MRNIVCPLTEKFKTSLWDLIPDEYCGTPDTFVSYAWTSSLDNIAQACCTNEHVRYVWIDFVCVCQHSDSEKNKQEVAKIGNVVKAVGSTLLCLDKDARALSRSWVLYEIVHSKRIIVAFFGRSGRSIASRSGVTDLRKIKERADALNYVLRVLKRCLGNGDFEKRTVRCARTEAYFEKDRRMILELVIDRFGSYEKADRYIIKLIFEGLVRYLEERGCDSSEIAQFSTARRSLIGCDS